MNTDSAHAWWSRLRHQGLLLSPVVMIERFSEQPPAVPWYAPGKLRDAYTRMTAAPIVEGGERNQKAVLQFVDSLIEDFIGHPTARLAKQHSIPEKFTAIVRIGSRAETLRPHRVLYADDTYATPALLIMADTSPQVGRGRGRTAYARFLELLRATGHRLGLLTNGSQFRLIYAGLDFESWCEWESERWFDDGEGTEELLALRQLLFSDSLKPVKDGVSGLLDAVEESRKRQADLSSVLRENVRQSVEMLLEDLSTASRLRPDLFKSLVEHGGKKLSDAEAQEALLQAAVRVVMRMVVCLFAESRQLLPVNDPIYAQSYGVRSLYELLDEAARYEGGTHVLFNRHTAWARLMALFRLIHTGSTHGSFPLRPYGGVLFRPGDATSSDPVARALHLLEHDIKVGDEKILYVLRKLLRGPLPVLRGHSKSYVDGPVDYTDLRTEFIGLIYEGLLDFRLKRTTEDLGPQVFLNLGREPVLPLRRLEDMLAHDKKALKDLLTTLKKEKVTAKAVEEGDSDTSDDDQDTSEDAAEDEPAPETSGDAKDVQRDVTFLDAAEAAKSWAREAVVLAGFVRKQGKKESDSAYSQEVDAEADRLIKKVVATGEFYLVRAGNTRKGTGTFYTRPQLAVPTAHRTLEPLCYDKAADGTLTPKPPETILALKVCDPACGSASFLVAALKYIADALFKSLCLHCRIKDPEHAARVTMPFGRQRKSGDGEQLIPFPSNDPQRGHLFDERVTALLRRHVVERCIYGVDINPLAVELARVSLWVETLDPELPFSFLDHKIKVGNALVGCWLDRVEDYPLKAWEREGGDGKDGPRTLRIEEFLRGEKVGKRRTNDGRIKQEMRRFIAGIEQGKTFKGGAFETGKIVAAARADYELLHERFFTNPDESERYYRDHMLRSPALLTLKAAMDEWCAVWFWPADEESLKYVPTPLEFHQPDRRARDEIVQQLAKEMKFFHWELEFPDVFTPERTGFDITLGNPPWDVLKPNSQEFFTEIDPLYRTYDKQDALAKQEEIFKNMTVVGDHWDEYNGRFKALGNWAKNVAEPFDLPLSRVKDGESLASLWAKHRLKRVGYSDAAHPFRLQGSADLNSYKLFAEFFWSLLNSDGRLGIILPTGIYSDFGTKELREELLFRGRLEFLYAFQNEKKLFNSADHRQKQVALFARRGGHTEVFCSLFRMGVGDSPEAHEIPDDILHHENRSMTFTPQDVRLDSPKTLSFVELKGKRDLAIFRTIYTGSTRIGVNASGWNIAHAREFDMTTDSKHFPSLEKWEAKSYMPDVFGRWIGPEGDLALPLYQGGMINLFDPFFKSWGTTTSGKKDWLSSPMDFKRLSARYAMSSDTYRNASPLATSCRIGYRGIARNTDTRTMICSYLPAYPCGNSVLLLALDSPDVSQLLRLQGLLSSLTFDWILRQRMSGSNLNWYVIEECPLAPAVKEDELQRRMVFDTAELSLIHRRFAPEWLRLKQLYPELTTKEWKHWWAVTPADRLRLRAEIDALCAALYGIAPDDFDWIVRDDPKDPKGFYRVDRQFPFRERLTGLAAAAFRALKAGRWSAESAARLSNDEFFELLGIPELTNPKAAKAKGLSAPLILNRPGCHRWAPEEFPPDDPRHGWTWEHCRQDAIALLGSEEALQKYLEDKPASVKKKESDEEEFKLRGEGPKQGRLF